MSSASAVAFFVLTACQNPTPNVSQTSQTPTAQSALQQTATATVTINTPTPANTPATAAPLTPSQTPAPTASANPAPSPGSAPTSTALPDGPAVVIGGVSFGAEIADTSALRTKGLSNRPSLPRQTGMLFIFPSGTASNFWMREMQFPLDFVWIGADCKVVSLSLNVPHPETPTSPLPLYKSSQPAEFNFEINGGEVVALGLAIGDDVRFNGIEVEGAHC